MAGRLARSWAQARYRVLQFWHTLTAARRPLDSGYVLAHLGAHPGLVRLFAAMPPAEQQHAVAVCQALESGGARDEELLTAALLHDAGKVQLPPRLWERVVAVLLERYLPRQSARWTAQPQAPAARLFKRALLVRHAHPRWGAELAAQAGASPRVVTLIRHHHASPPPDSLDAPTLAALQALQRVDGEH